MRHSTLQNMNFASPMSHLSIFKLKLGIRKCISFFCISFGRQPLLSLLSSKHLELFEISQKPKLYVYSCLCFIKIFLLSLQLNVLYWSHVSKIELLYSCTWPGWKKICILKGCSSALIIFLHQWNQSLS